MPSFVATLTDSQRQLMRAMVAAEQGAAPVDVEDNLDSAKALVRSGYALWYPPLAPIAYTQRANIDRTAVTPTPLARQWVARYGDGT